MNRFRSLATGTAALTLLLVAVGALVRATGSGLGCLDDWPLCRGGWVAPADYAAVIEYSHRVLAGIVVLALVAQAFVARRWAPGSFGLSLWALATVVAQAALGRVVVTSELHAAYVTAHLGLAMALVALTTVIAVRMHLVGRPTVGGPLARMSAGAAAGVAAVLVAGAYVREKGAGLAFADWPLMDGRLIPDLSGDSLLHFVHRVLAALVLVHLVVVWRRARSAPGARTMATIALGLYVLQVLAGAANVFTRLAPAAVLLHVAGGALVWASVVALAVMARRGANVDAEVRMPAPIAGGSAEAGLAVAEVSPGVLSAVRAYVQLTKPRIILLLLVTTVPAMVVAARELPGLSLVAATLLGGMLTAGSANAFNQCLERDIDSHMRRTRGRPLPTDRVSPVGAVLFGAVLGVAGTVWLVWSVNVLAAALAASAIFFYVGVYTALLKRSTPQNIVIGGAAGAVPVLVGWAAVTGGLAAAAWAMFAIVFLWTPPHFWALAMRYREDYARAGVPMLPVVRSQDETTRQILWYSVAMVASTLVLVAAADLGWLYSASAALLGAGFLVLAVRLRRTPDAASAMRLFKYSINYLALLFAAVALDALLVSP